MRFHKFILLFVLATLSLHVSAGGGNTPKNLNIVDLGLSVKWANMNLGATKPEEYGGFFQWSRTNIAKAEWGGNWRLPTKEEATELVNKCTWRWTSKNNINGYLVIGKNGCSIFLPTAGNTWIDKLDNRGWQGYYWLNSDQYYFLIFNEYVNDVRNGESQFCNFSIRPVIDSIPKSLFTYKGLNYEITSDATAAVANQDSNSVSGDIIIPETITYNSKKYLVTAIDNWAFKKCEQLTSISIPNSITSIGESAFMNCSSLRSVKLPDNITEINDWTFTNCRNLKSLKIPHNVTAIRDNVFTGSGLVSISIPETVKVLGVSPFIQCDSLRQISVDSHNTNYCDIDGILYSKDKKTIICYPEGKASTSFTIPNSVTKIGPRTFEYSKITSVDIPNTVDTIFNNAFAYCKLLESIILPNSVRFIGERIFKNCTSLVYVLDQSSIQKISTKAFERCYSLKMIKISDSVILIGMYAFCYCRSLVSITIPKYVKNIGVNAFTGCSSLKEVRMFKPISLFDNYNYFNSNLANNLRTLYVPKGMKTAFLDCNEEYAHFKEIKEME